MSTLLRAIAEPRRQAILRMVWNRERSAGEIAEAFDVTFGAVSQHLKVLRDVKAVRVRKEGRQRWYRADQNALGPLATHLAAMWNMRLDHLKVLAEAEEVRHGKH